MTNQIKNKMYGIVSVTISVNFLTNEENGT